MTDAEFRTWINTNININGRKSITGALANELGMKFIEYCANIDTPLLPYSLTISNDELTALAITVTHGKNTWLPDFIMYNENGLAIYSEYYDAQIVNANSITFTFHDAIPVTGNGYYRVLIWNPGIANVTPRYTNVFTSTFTSWTGDVPDGYTVEIPFFSSASIVNSSGRALMTKDGISSIRLIPEVTFEQGREYRLSLNLVSGNVKLICGNITYSILIAGINTITFVADGTSLTIKNGTAASAIIDDLVIDEMA